MFLNSGSFEFKNLSRLRSSSTKEKHLFFFNQSKGIAPLETNLFNFNECGMFLFRISCRSFLFFFEILEYNGIEFNQFREYSLLFG